MIMNDDFLRRLEAELASAATVAEVENLRRKFLGKKSEFAEERRTLGSLSEQLRRERGAGQGVELGSDRPQSPHRAHVPPLRADQGLVRRPGHCQTSKMT